MARPCTPGSPAGQRIRQPSVSLFTRRQSGRPRTVARRVTS